MLKKNQHEGCLRAAFLFADCLFVAKCINRIQPRCFLRGVVAKEYTGHYAKTFAQMRLLAICKRGLRWLFDVYRYELI